MPTPNEISRRQFMANAARSYLGLSLPPAIAASMVTPALAQATATGKAKSVIFLNMAGGMSQLDTFDPKPKANKDYTGDLEVIGTSADRQISHYLPHTAKVMDRLCVINSMTSRQGAHPQGEYQLIHNYEQRGTIAHPSFGSWVLKLGGRLNPSIPGYVAIGSPPSGGFFGANYSAVPVNVPEQGLKNVLSHHSVDQEDFQARLSLADKLNANFHSQFNHSQVKAYDDLYDEAVKLMKSEDLKAFDISKEPKELRDAYGRNHFGQGCLLARRLVQHDVRFIYLRLAGWDTHYDNFNGVEKRSRVLDAAYATLITDLERNGLLDSTVVALGTEFGRSPEIKTEHNNGRDHHPAAFSCVLAGGGIKGGQTYGRTDGKAARVKENPVSHQDFNATIAHALGLPLDKVLYSPSKRPFTIANNDGELKGKPIKSIFA